jgi:hypothetical protein
MRVSVESAQILAVIHLCIPTAGLFSRRIKPETFSMPSFVARFAVIASFALSLAAFASGARSEHVTPGNPPDAVTEAVAASPAPSGAAKVVVGAYINDIQELDFRSNSYAIDLYVWFRWKPAADLNPSKTIEFMNRYASDANIRDELYDVPKADA